MFPQYAISTSTSITGNTSYTLVSTTSPTYIFGVRMQQSGQASQTVVTCPTIGGGVGYPAFNFAKDYPLDLLRFPCYGNIVINKTGNDISFVSITYATQQQADALVTIPVTVSLPVATTTGTSTVIYAENGFSYEGMIMILLLLVLVTGQFFGGILNRVIGVKVKQRFHGKKIIL